MSHSLLFAPNYVTRVGGLKLVAALCFSHILAMDLVAWFGWYVRYAGPGTYSHCVIHDARGSDAPR
jgi:hypothetical protein